MASLYWPVGPQFNITQPFGPTTVTAEDPITWPGGQGIAAGYYAHFHRAVDLGDGSCGDPIYAAGDGTVHYAGLISVPSAPGGWQSLITLDHGGGIASGYIHQATWSVAPGQRVNAHQQIGTVGKYGAYACHSHFFVKSGVNFSNNVLADSNGSWLDPVGVVLQMYANDRAVVLAAPNPRHFTIPANTTLNGYDPAQPGKIVKTFGPVSTASGADADTTDTVTWYGTSAPPVPRGGPFLHVTDGVLAGLLIVASLVQLDPAAPALTQAQVDAQVLAAKQGQYDLDAKSITISSPTASLSNPRP